MGSSSSKSADPPPKSSHHCIGFFGALVCLLVFATALTQFIEIQKQVNNINSYLPGNVPGYGSTQIPVYYDPQYMYNNYCKPQGNSNTPPESCVAPYTNSRWELSAVALFVMALSLWMTCFPGRHFVPAMGVYYSGHTPFHHAVLFLINGVLVLGMATLLGFSVGILCFFVALLWLLIALCAGRSDYV